MANFPPLPLLAKNGRPTGVEQPPRLRLSHLRNAW
jgi:hypothetical protein